MVKYRKKTSVRHARPDVRTALTHRRKHMETLLQGDADGPKRSARIRDMNDNFRRTFIGGVVTVTQGVDALCREVKSEVMRRVRTFDHFNTDNDPHGEHDFGSFDLAGDKFFWKIDYYDPTLESGSEDPTDPTKTTRVLTLMLAAEY